MSLVHQETCSFVCVCVCACMCACAFSFLFFLENNPITGAPHTHTHTHNALHLCWLSHYRLWVMRAQLSVCNGAQTFGPSLHRILLLLFHVDPLNRTVRGGHGIDVRDGGCQGLYTQQPSEPDPDTSVDSPNPAPNPTVPPLPQIPRN